MCVTVHNAKFLLYIYRVVHRMQSEPILDDLTRVRCFIVRRFIV